MKRIDLKKLPGSKEERFIGTTLAMEIARESYPKISRPTIIRWCHELRAGLKIGGRWRVDRVKLMEILRGERFYGKKLP